MDTTAASAWDTHAATYDTLYAPLTGFIAHNMLRLTEGQLPPGAQILDIACGTGALALPAAEWLRAQHATPRGRVLATDFSSTMVEATQRAANARGLGELVQSEVHDGLALQLPDASFDAVYSCFGIFLFPDRDTGWREAARVLKPGGVFATTVWRGPEHNEMLRAQMAPLMAALPDRLRQRPARSWLDIADAKGLEAEIMQTGAFVEPRVIALQGSIVIPSPAIAWAAMIENPVTGALLRACTPEERTTIEKSVLAALTKHAGGADRPILYDVGANVFVARRA